MVPKRPRVLVHAALSAALSVAMLGAGCSRSNVSPDATVLDDTYVSVGYPGGEVELTLGPDGAFTMREARPAIEQMRRPSQPIARGIWEVSEHGLELRGGEWRTFFAPDSTRVEVPGRADTIRSLRWLSSTAGSPFHACDLVSSSDFENFLNPPEGSGSEGGFGG